MIILFLHFSDLVNYVLCLDVMFGYLYHLGNDSCAVVFLVVIVDVFMMVLVPQKKFAADSYSRGYNFFV